LVRQLLMIKQLQTQYNIINQIDLTAWHDKSIIDRQIWLERLVKQQYRDFFNINERIVFTMTRGDIYDSADSEVGSFITEFQRCLNSVDISNYFVILLVNDTTIKQSYDANFKSFSQDSVPITIIVTEPTITQKQIKKPVKQYSYNSKEPNKIDLNTLDQRKRDLLVNSKTFCIYPWIHLHAYPTGQAYPCCMVDMNYPVGNVKKNTIEEIWNQEPMRMVRRNMLSNCDVDGCARCYEQEAAGFVSGRVSANKHHGHHIHKIDKTDDNGYHNEFELTYWDIRFSNLCNLRCRSCGHIFSSQWYQDQAQIAGPGWKNQNQVLNYAGQTETDMWEQLEPHLEYVEQIYFAGGEPLLMEEHYNILEELVKRQRFDVRLIYNTNFTHTKLKDRSVFEYWKLFDSVSVGASLDAMGPRAEYIRKGTNWANVEQNRRDMMAICPNVDFYISPTLSILNAHHLPEFHRNWVEKGLIRAQDLNVNVLQDPPHYRVDIAPKEYKEELSKKYSNHIAWLREQDSLKRATQGFESAINFLNATDNSHLIPTFWEKTNQLDGIRSEQLLSVIPELRALK